MEEKYSTTEVVLVSEVIKLIASAMLVMQERSSSGLFACVVRHQPYLIVDVNSDSRGSIFSHLFLLILSAKKILLLVILYLICNILAYVALSNVGPAVYTVLQQLKILTTAGFSVLLLNRFYSSTQWRALLLLILGCILVVSPTLQSGCENNNTTSEEEKEYLTQSIIGILATIVMVLISGFGAAYFEKILKQETSTVWERNFQLAFYSIFFLLLINIMDALSYSFQEDRTSTKPMSKAYEPAGNHFKLFEGWTFVTVIIAITQAGGGLLVAGTLKYADSILKTLATSISIVLSAILSHLLLDTPLDIFIGIGCVVTILSVINYTFDATPPPQNL